MRQRNTRLNPRYLPLAQQKQITHHGILWDTSLRVRVLNLGSMEDTMLDLYWLSDDAWALLEPHHNRPGRPRVDDQRVISGILRAAL